MVTFFNQGDIPEEQLRYAVIAARFQEKWVFCRRKGRDTWEIPGGKREPGEAILDTAWRELAEETGAAQFDLTPICIYAVERQGSLPSYGLLCFARIERMEPLHSEIEEIRLDSVLPKSLTYPAIQPALYDRIQAWRNVQDSPDELWDIYDRDGNLTGRLHRRGDPLRRGDYHLTVHIWLQDTDGKFLVTQRAPNKGYAGLWECTGGSALAGEDSRTAAVREVLEETGLTILPEAGERLLHRQREDDLNDVWLFRQKIDRTAIRLLPGETVDAKWVTAEQILEMEQAGEMVPFAYLKKLFSETLKSR